MKKKNIFYGIGGLISGICMFAALCLAIVIFTVYSCALAMGTPSGQPVDDTLLNIVSSAVSVVAIFAMMIALIISIRGFCGGRVASFFVGFEILLHLAIAAASVYFAIPEISVSAQLTGSFVFFIVFAVINVICITLYVLGMVSKKKKERQEEAESEEQPA